MIKIYDCGNALVDENIEFLNTNKYVNAFFLMDAKFLTTCDKINYAIKCTNDDKTLLFMKVEPWNLLVFGDSECVPEMVKFLMDSNYEVKGLLGPNELTDVVALELSKYGIKESLLITMDFMEAREKTIPSCDEVVQATIDDYDTILDYSKKFIADCGLTDSVNKGKIKTDIEKFYYIKKDGIIVSMAKIAESSDIDQRISAVYTPPMYRGNGYAKLVVNTCKNIIIDRGFTATLNVDRKNPISNHIYSSIGFKIIFAQGLYERVN